MFLLTTTTITGAGMQILVTVLLVVGSALLDLFDVAKRGNVLSALILTHAITSGLGGYISARLYRQLDGAQWVSVLLDLCVVSHENTHTHSLTHSHAIHTHTYIYISGFF